MFEIWFPSKFHVPNELGYSGHLWAMTKFNMNNLQLMAYGQLSTNKIWFRFSMDSILSLNRQIFLVLFAF